MLSSSAVPSTRGRGRPPNPTAVMPLSSASAPEPSAVLPSKRGRGRPPKQAPVLPSSLASTTESSAVLPSTRGRGRPPNPKTAVMPSSSAPDSSAVPPLKRGRGRPPKQALVMPSSLASATESSAVPPLKRGRGRPPKQAPVVSVASDATEEPSEPQPKRHAPSRPTPPPELTLAPASPPRPRLPSPLASSSMGSPPQLASSSSSRSVSSMSSRSVSSMSSRSSLSSSASSPLASRQTSTTVSRSQTPLPQHSAPGSDAALDDSYSAFDSTANESTEEVFPHDDELNDDEAEVEAQAVARTRGKTGFVTATIEYNTEEELKALLKTHELTSKGKTVGFRKSYTCKKRGCPVSGSSFMEGGKGTLTVRNHHEHDDENMKGVSAEVRDLVQERLREHGPTNAKSIRTTLRSRGVSEDKISNDAQIRNYVAHAKKKEQNGNVFTCARFRSEMEARLIRDDDPEDKVGVLDYDVTITAKEPAFYAIFSSKKQLNRLHEQHHMQCDATYKVMYYKHAMMMLGFSDENHTFHPVAMALVDSESTFTYTKLFEAVASARFKPKEVLADGDAAITAAARAVYPDALRRMCRFHMTTNIKRSYSKFGVPKECQRSIYKGVTKLMRATSATVLDTAVTGFLDELEELNCDDFGKYFKKEYVKVLPNWISLPGYGPTSNNGLESTNSKYKQQYTFKKRMNEVETFDSMENFLKEYLTMEPKTWTPEMEDFKQAHLLKREHRKKMTVADGFAMARRDNNLSDEESKTAIRNYFADSPNYDDLCKFFNNFHLVTQSELFSRRFWCSCSYFHTNHNCKHSLLAEVRQGYRRWPANIEEASTRLGVRRKAGRPRQTGSAWVRDAL